MTKAMNLAALETPRVKNLVNALATTKNQNYDNSKINYSDICAALSDLSTDIINYNLNGLNANLERRIDWTK